MRPRFPALFLVIALVGAACGDDDLATPENETPSEEPSESDTGGDVPPESGVSDDPSGDRTDDEPAGDGTKSTPRAEAKQVSDTLADLFDGEVSPESEQCMVAALLGDPELLAAVVAAGPDAELTVLPESQQIAAIDLALSCVTEEEIVTAIAAGFDADMASSAFAGPAAECIGGRLADESTPDRTQLLLGFIAVGEGREPTPEQGEQLVDLMLECVDSGLLVDAMLVSALDDPVIATAVDGSCLDAAVDDDYVERFWRLVVSNPDSEFEELPADQRVEVVGPIFECISWGTLFATGAAEAGVDLSESTIACIDDSFDPATLVDALMAGEEPEGAQLIRTVLPCLSPEELSALG